MEKLAIYGGDKVKTTPFTKEPRFGKEELRQLEEAMAQDTLFYWKGSKVKELNRKFADLYGMKYCVATSSGTAAVHTALSAVGVTAGDEVITSPVTDMGSIIGIIYQNAIPVFADIDPYTYNMRPEAIEACITDKTKAILVVHLMGNAADMDPIMEIAKKYNVAVVEDCAQAYMTYYKGRLAGTIGDIGCFSLNDFKQISAGDGGMCITNNENLYHRGWKFTDKNYSRTGDTVSRDIEHIAPNYRMSELVGAVGVAQIDKVVSICQRRNRIGDRIVEETRDLPGIYPPAVYGDSKSSYFSYLFRINEKELGTDIKTFMDALKAEGIPCYKGYIDFCIYEYDMFKNKTGFEGTHAPFDSPYYGRSIEYKAGLCPNAETFLKDSVRIYIRESFSQQDVDEIIRAIRKVALWFSSHK